jgi:chromosome segregation ATPase
MCKKLGIAALLIAAGVFAFKKTDAGSYVSTLWDQCKTTATKQVSLEFEIERIRKDIDKLIPDMKANLGTLAREMVAVETLRDDIASTRVNLEKQKVKLNEMKDALQSDVSPVVFNGRAYKADRLREMLVADLTACKRCEESVQYKEQLLEAKERAVDSAKEQLGTIRAQKQELEVQLAQLEAEIKTVRVAQARSKVQLDDSRLAKVKASIQDVRNRLKVEVREAELVGEFVPQEAPIVQPKVKTNDQVLAEVDAYLNGSAPKNGEKVAERR